MGWLALTCVVTFALAVTYVVGARGAATWAVVAVAIAIAGPTWLGRLTGDFTTATGLTGLACLAGVALLWSRGPEPSGGLSERVGPTPLVLRIPIAVAAAGVIWAALGSHFWDEHSCHYSTAAVIARGVFPPEHPLFPGEPFRYHFGYDVLAAHARVLTGVPIDVALDVATIGSFLLLLAVCRDLGRRLAGAWGGGFAMLVVPLGGGTLAFLLFGDMGPLEMHWNALPRRWMNSTPPPVISNFFQHPQGLGMSFALAVVDVFTRATDDRGLVRGRDARWHLGLGAFLLGTLALVHIVFFAVLGLALGVMVVVRGVEQRALRPAVEALGALLVALALGVSLGGFFAQGPPVEQVLRWGTSFFEGDLPAIVAQHLVLFGLPLIFLPVAVAESVRRRTPLVTVLVTAALVGFVVPNVVTYARSWDIVKFLGVGMFFANLLFAARLARWVQRGRAGAVAAAVCALLVTNTGWLWLARCSVLDGRLGVPKIHFPGSSRAGHRVALAVEGVIPPDQRVWTTDVALVRASGLLAPGFDWRRYGVGFMLDRRRAERWHRLKQQGARALAPEVMKALGVRWAIFGPSELARLDRRGRQRLDDPAWYEPVLTVGAGADRRQVFRMRPPAFGATP